MRGSGRSGSCLPKAAGTGRLCAWSCVAADCWLGLWLPVEATRETGTGIRLLYTVFMSRDEVGRSTAVRACGCALLTTVAPKAGVCLLHWHFSLGQLQSSAGSCFLTRELRSCAGRRSSACQGIDQWHHNGLGADAALQTTQGPLASASATKGHTRPSSWKSGATRTRLCLQRTSPWTCRLVGPAVPRVLQGS